MERETIEREMEQVDGIVIASSRMTDSGFRMMVKQKPVVLLNRIIPEVTCVVNDQQRGVRRAAEHLAALGHERIHDVSGLETSWSDGIRWRALREAATDLGWTCAGGPNEPTVLAGIGAARQVVRLDASAVLAYNDQLAIGVMKGLRKLGVAVPDDISVIGIDNIILDELVEPTLTTIAAPLYRMGFTGVRNCIAVAPARGRAAAPGPARPAGGPPVDRLSAGGRAPRRRGVRRGSRDRRRSRNSIVAGSR